MEKGKRRGLKGLEGCRLLNSNLKMRSKRKRKEVKDDGVCRRTLWGS